MQFWVHSDYLQKQKFYNVVKKNKAKIKTKSSTKVEIL